MAVCFILRNGKFIWDPGDLYKSSPVRENAEILPWGLKKPTDDPLIYLQDLLKSLEIFESYENVAKSGWHQGNGINIITCY